MSGQRKGLACGDRLAQYKAGGMVGRPPRKYVVDTPKHEQAETKKQELAEHRRGHKEK